MKKVLFILAVFAVSSCVYPFTPDISQISDGRIVIEGDIILGTESTFTLSRIADLDASKEEMDNMSHPKGEVWVESSDGKKYNANSQGDGIYVADMSGAEENLSYSLHALISGREYRSTPTAAQSSCTIAALEYEIDGTVLNLYADIASSQKGYYRISFMENWEYNSLYRDYSKYMKPSKDLPEEFRSTGMIVDMPADESMYHCWNSRASSDLMLFTNEGMDSFDLKKLQFHSLQNTDRRISYVYAVDVYVDPISKDEYDYLDHLKEISDYNGSLFSPNPSEMRGNIRCAADTTEMVIGYINTIRRSTRRLFIYNYDTNFYVRTAAHYEDILEKVQPGSWWSLYLQGYLPFDGNDRDGYSWADKRCVDCTLVGGGSKSKPAWWPNTDI